MKRAALLLLVACATPSKLPADPDDAAASLRASIAKSPGDIHSTVLMEQLASVEFERARRANTVLAYRQYLNEFPESDDATSARALLEELRFKEAERLDTHQGWEDFLEEHPRGKHAAEAREHLGSHEIEAALKSSDLELVHRTMARFPDHPRRDALAGHEDDLVWATALKGGMDAVDAYLTAHPNGAHRLDAIARRDVLEQQEILDAEDLVRAQARARAADATGRRRATVAALRLARALATLNIEDVQAVAVTDSTEPEVVAVKARAQAFLTAWNANPPSAAVMQMINNARAGSGLRPHDETVARTRSGDPVEQIAALRELAEWSRRTDVDVALDALKSHYVAVRLAAVECLRSLASSLKPAVWRAAARAHEEATLAQSRDDGWMRIAALRDASGRTDEAIEAWRASLRTVPDDLAAQARILALLIPGKDRLAVNTAARDLVKSAIDFGKGHVPNEIDPNRPPPEDPGPGGEVIGVPGDLSAERQLCASIDLAASASQTLAAERARATQEERELLQLAGTESETDINWLRERQIELERSLVSRGVRFPACNEDLSAVAIEKSRQARAAAIASLGALKDSRLAAFIEAQQFTPAPEVRAAVDQALPKQQAASAR